MSPEPAGWKAWRYVAQTFLSAGSGDFPVACPSPTFNHTRSTTSPFPQLQSRFDPTMRFSAPPEGISETFLIPRHRKNVLGRSTSFKPGANEAHSDPQT